MELQLYAYQPIKQKSEIRLFMPQAGNGDEPIRGELVTISTGDRHDYNAVSYTWADDTGDATRRCRAFIGNGYVPITRSCEEVLQRIRRRYYTRNIWIDSICVDQSNLLERGNQVDLMPRIYTRATKTYVYVGITTDEDELVLQNSSESSVQPSWNMNEPLFWANSFAAHTSLESG